MCNSVLPHPAKLKKMTENPNYYPIETAPKDGTNVLLYGGDIYKKWIDDPDDELIQRNCDWVKAHYYNLEWCVELPYGTARLVIENPTHWTPLPPEPKEDD